MHCREWAPNEIPDKYANGLISIIKQLIDQRYSARFEQ